MGPRKHVLYGGAHWHHLANTIEPCVCGTCCCRVFALIENSVHQHTRGSDSASSENLNPEEAMLDVCLLSTTNSVMQQCSLPIYLVCQSVTFFVVVAADGID